MVQKKIISFVLVAILSCASAWAQVTFQATASQSCELGGTWRVVFKVNDSDATDFTPPSFENFDVMSGPSSSVYSNYQMINGKFTSESSLAITYLLSPNVEGELTLGEATVKVDGKVYKSKPIKVKVTPRSSGGSASGDEARQDGGRRETIQQAGTKVTPKDLYFTVTLSRDTLYEQQAVLLTYKYYARTGVGLTNISLQQQPDMKNFYVESMDLPDHLEHNTEMVNGHLYKTGVYLQYLIFPQKSGTLIIPPIQIDCKVVQQERVTDPFDFFFNNGGQVVVDVQRKTPEVKFNVLPLPSPAPANFSGAVGNFQIKGSVLENVVKTNDVATYRLSVEGNGNMKLLRAPSPEFPADFEVYPAKTDEKLQRTASGIKGHINYDYTFVPRNVGEYVIPQIDYVYFDPEEKAYKTIQAEPFPVNIKQGKNAGKTPTLKKREEDILPIINAKERQGGEVSMVWLGSLGYYMVLAVLFFLFLVLVVFWRIMNKRRNDVVGKRRRGAHRKASKHLKKVSAMLKDGSAGAAFYGELSRAMKNYISDKYSVQAMHLSSSSLCELLSEKGVSHESLQQLRSLLDECEFQQFSGNPNPSKMNELLSQAEHVISVIESGKA